MSSWFSNFDTTSTLTKLSELSTKVKSTVQDNVNNIKIPDAVSKAVDSDLIKNLTLTSDELTKVYTEIESEERRKEMVRDYLAELLPWETRDETKVIHIEECRQVILSISTKEQTFTYPFAPPPGVHLFPIEEEEDKVPSGDTQQDDAEGATISTTDTKTEASDANDNNDNTKDTNDDNTPTESNTNTNAEQDDAKWKEEAQQKLEKLQPLPPLLENFDLDTHVGLIERLLTVDDELVEMHAMLTGAGEKEKLFWKNYFFHCAYVRYDSGLSIDEIWASKPEPVSTQEVKEETEAAIAARRARRKQLLGLKKAVPTSDDATTEEMVFDSVDESNANTPPTSSSPTNKVSSPTSGNASPLRGSVNTSSNPANSAAVASTSMTSKAASIISTTGGTSASDISGGSGTSYEMVEDGVDDAVEDDIGDVMGDDDEDFGDDLDDLEAEIARELEDD